MKTTLQATGYPPVTFNVTREVVSRHMLEGDKRGVEVAIYEVEGRKTVGRITYLSTWGTEREFTRLFTPQIGKPYDAMREAAADTLPPGAGFPATAAFETRQSKLRGTMQTLTLVALSDVLRELEPPPP